MTKEDIARMAREAGWFEGQASDVCIACSRFGINRFAELVAAHGREECAGLFEKLLNETINCLATESAEHKLVKNITSQFKEGITAAIRARGEK